MRRIDPPPTADFVDSLARLVATESPSYDRSSVEAGQGVLDELGRDLLGLEASWRAQPDGPPTLSWSTGDPDDPARVLLLGHVDTVFPLGTVARRPFDVRDGLATGPGVFDMKAGLLVALHAMRSLGPDRPVTLLVTGDEEIGSWGSRDLIAAEARRSQAVIVLEGAGPGGAVKSSRKGWSVYRFELHGRAAHAGLEPHKGCNTLLGLATAIQQVAALNQPESGRTVTPTTATAGTTVNTVPDRAELSVDVRVESAEDQDAVDRAIRRLEGVDEHGVEIRVGGGVDRPPMPRSAAVDLLARLDGLPRDPARPDPGDIAVGGISDANLTAALGVPTIDGLGAVGGGPHSEHEWVDVEATIARISLVTSLADDLITHPLPAAAPPTSQTRTRP